MSGIQPLVAPLAAGGGQQQQQLNPFQLLNEVAQLQGRLLDNQNKANSQRAQADLSEVFATTDPLKLPEALMGHPGIAYHPELMTHAAQATQALVNMSRERQQMSQTAIDQYRKDLIPLFNDPFPSAEGAEAIRMTGAANIVDPIARQVYLDKSKAITDALVAGAPSRAELMANPELAQKWGQVVKNRILGQAGAVWGWEASRDIILGGPTFIQDGVLFQKNFDGTIRQLGPAVRPPRPVPATPEPGGPSTGPEVAPPGGGSGSSVPPGGIPDTMDAAGAGGGADDAGAPNALMPGGGGAPASLQMPMPPDAAAGMPGYAPGAVEQTRLPPMPGTAGPDGPLPPGPPEETQMAQAAQGGPGAIGGGPTRPAPPPPPSKPPPGTAPMYRENGDIVWGPGASTHHTANGGKPVALSDGRLLDSTTGKPPDPTNYTLTGKPIYSDAVSERVKALQTELGEMDKKAENARALLSQTDQVRASLNELQRTGGWFTPGVGNPQRMQMFRVFNDMANVLGYKMSPDEVRAEAAFTNIQKLQTVMGFSGVNQFFGAAREAATIIQSAMAAVPGVENSFLGGQLVNRMIEVMSQRLIDQHRFYKDWFDRHDGDLRGADVAFNKAHSITDMTQSVLSEFGMGRYGFKNRDGTVDKEGVRLAFRRMYINEQQAGDIIAGKTLTPNRGMESGSR